MAIKKISKWRLTLFMERLMFIIVRFPCLSADEFRNIKAVSEPDELYLFEEVCYHKFRIFHIIWFLVDGLNASYVWFTFKTTFQLRRINEDRASKNGNTMISYGCIRTDCPANYPLEYSSQITPRVTSYHLDYGSNLQSDLSTLPLFHLCNQAWITIIVPLVETGELGLLLQLILCMCYSFYRLSLILLQCIYPLPDYIILFSLAPKTIRRMYKTHLIVYAIELKKSLIIFSSSWLNRMNYMSILDRLTSAEKSHFRKQREAFDYQKERQMLYYLMYPPREQSIPQNQEPHVAKGQLPADKQMPVRTDGGDSLIRQELEQLLIDCVPLSRGEWWRQIVFRAYMVNFVSVLCTMASSVMVISAGTWWLGLRNQAHLAEYKRRLTKLNCSLWVHQDRSVIFTSDADKLDGGQLIPLTTDIFDETYELNFLQIVSLHIGGILTCFAFTTIVTNWCVMSSECFLYVDEIVESLKYLIELMAMNKWIERNPAIPVFEHVKATLEEADEEARQSGRMFEFPNADSNDIELNRYGANYGSFDLHTIRALIMVHNDQHLDIYHRSNMLIWPGCRYCLYGRLRDRLGICMSRELLVLDMISTMQIRSMRRKSDLKEKEQNHSDDRYTLEQLKHLARTNEKVYLLLRMFIVSLDCYGKMLICQLVYSMVINFVIAYSCMLLLNQFDLLPYGVLWVVFTIVMCDFCAYVAAIFSSKVSSSSTEIN